MSICENSRIAILRENGHQTQITFKNHFVLVPIIDVQS